MKYGSIHIEKVSRDEWLKSWDNTDYATFFEHPDWFDCWNVMYPGSTPAFALRITSVSNFSVLVPCFERKIAKGLISTFECGPGGLYGGPLDLKIKANSQVLELICSQLAQKLKNVNFRINPFIISDASLESDSTSFTQVVDLTNRTDVLNALRATKVDYDHRSASRKGLRISIATDADLINFSKTYEKLRATWKNPGSYYPFEFFSKLMESDHSDFWSVYKDELYIGGGILLKGKINISSWLTVMDPDYTSFRPYEFTYHELLNHYANQGFQWFDFNPSAGLEGVVKFKEKFGTIRKAFVQFQNTSNLKKLISCIHGGTL